jgi:hypothetical protein
MPAAISVSGTVEPPLEGVPVPPRVPKVMITCPVRGIVNLTDLVVQERLGTSQFADVAWACFA